MLRCAVCREQAYPNLDEEPHCDVGNLIVADVDDHLLALIFWEEDPLKSNISPNRATIDGHCSGSDPAESMGKHIGFIFCFHWCSRIKHGNTVGSSRSEPFGSFHRRRIMRCGVVGSK